MLYSTYYVVFKNMNVGQTQSDFISYISVRGLECFNFYIE